MPTPLVNHKCYTPDGSEVTTDAPCYNETSDGYSHCCSSYTQVCLDNRLCYTNLQGMLLRSSCTDQTWQSPSCPPYCVDTYPNAAVGVFGLNQNTNENCCIGWNLSNSGCLDGNPTFSVLPGNVIQGAGTLTAAVVSATATATMTITTTAHVAAATTSSSGVTSEYCPPDHDVAIGAGIGVPLGLAVLALAFLLFRQQKRGRKGFLKDSDHHEVKRPLVHQFEQGSNSEIDGRPKHEIGEGRQIRPGLELE